MQRWMEAREGRGTVGSGGMGRQWRRPWVEARLWAGRGEGASEGLGSREGVGLRAAWLGGSSERGAAQRY